MIALSAHNISADDETLVNQVAEGQIQSLGVLFDRYHLSVRRFLARMQIAPADLDDLVQVTFLQVPRAAVRFEAGRSVKGWLFGLATMVVRRHRRTIGRLARKMAALAREPLARAPRTPAELLGEQESFQRANRALAALAVKKREVFVMVILEKLSGETVAQALGIPIGTVWTRLHHGRRELKDLLAEDDL